MTGAGNANFEGTRHWLSTTESKLEGIEFALCLDTLGSSENLYLHISRLGSKDPNAEHIYKTFEQVAQEMKVNFSVVHKKVNISGTYIPWQHEQFARRHVLGMTLSQFSSPPAFCQDLLYMISQYIYPS